MLKKGLSIFIVSCKLIQSVKSPDPQIFELVLGNGSDGVVGEGGGITVLGEEDPELIGFWIVAIQPHFGTDPDFSQVILKKASDYPIAERVVALATRFVCLDLKSVVAVQTGIGAKPEKALLILQYAAGYIGRQAVLHLEVLELQFGVIIPEIVCLGR